MNHALVRALLVWALLICAAITLSVSWNAATHRHLERSIKAPLPPFACMSMSLAATDIAIRAGSPRMGSLAAPSLQAVRNSPFSCEDIAQSRTPHEPRIVTARPG
jgi:hypothetical protein